MPLPPDLNKPIFAIMPELADRVINSCCTYCNAPIKPNEFKDKISAKEFSISGMCQSCQDDIFQAFEEEEANEPW